MKKVFENDSSYIEIVKSSKKDHLMLSLCARDPHKPDHITMISVEIANNDLLDLIEQETKGA